MNEFLINTGALESAIRSLQPFMEKKNGERYFLQSVFFELGAGQSVLHMVATDGVKLCIITRDIDPATDNVGDIKSIVPAAALKTILQILKAGGNVEMPVTLKFDDKKNIMYIDSLDQKAELRLIDATYPDYRQVIPLEEPKFRIGLEKAQAVEAMKAVSKHRGKEQMEWQMTNQFAPMKVVGEDKLIVIMPCKTDFQQMDLMFSA